MQQVIFGWLITAPKFCLEFTPGDEVLLQDRLRPRLDEMSHERLPKRDFLQKAFVDRTLFKLRAGRTYVSYRFGL